MKTGRAPGFEVRRERGELSAGWLEARFSFSFAGVVHAGGDSFGPILALNEDVVAPASGFPMHPHQDLEIFMIPLAGGLAHEDSLGGRCTVKPGQVLMMRAGAGIRHSQMNASAQVPDHHLQLWIQPRARGLRPEVSLRAVGETAAGGWHLLAAPGGIDATFDLAQDARVMLGTAAAGRPLGMEIAKGSAAYLHVIDGSCRAGMEERHEPLAAGDALAIRSAPGSLRIEALDQPAARVLLVVFPASLLLRNPSSAAVRAGR